MIGTCCFGAVRLPTGLGHALLLAVGVGAVVAWGCETMGLELPTAFGHALLLAVAAAVVVVGGCETMGPGLSA